MTGPADDSAIRQLGSEWNEAWDRHDAHALVLLVLCAANWADCLTNLAVQ